MRRKLLCRLGVALSCVFMLVSVAGAERITLTVSNPLDVDRPNAICVGQAISLAPGVAPGAYQGTVADGRTISVQLDDVNGNGIADDVVMVLDLPANGSVSVWLDTRRSWVGDEWTDARESWRWDGYAALETDRMAFGLYGIHSPLSAPGSLQWDLYGKRPEAWGLSLDALEGIDYHQDNEVAVDFLLVGSSMGLGGPIIGDARPMSQVNGTFEYRKISTGPVRAGLEVTVEGWETGRGGSYDATIQYFVYAHHDFIDAGFTLISRADTADLFGVGLRRIPTPDVFIGSGTEGVLALMGQQEGIIGRTGMAVLFEPERYVRWGVRTAEDSSYVVYLDPVEREEFAGRFYRSRLVGVWSEGGIADVETFGDHCRDLARRFRHPVQITR